MLNSRNVTTLGAIILFTTTAITIHIHTVSAKNENFHNETKVLKSETKSNETLSLVQENTDFSGLFAPLPVPGPHDWLANQHEEGQTFKEFLYTEKNDISKSRNTIYILPIWSFDKTRSPDLELLRKFTEIYFSAPVKLLPPISPNRVLFSPRINSHTGKDQVHAGEILSYLMEKLPEDAYCLLGITMVDLYPDPSWNYVFGYATYFNRVGVFSFARFDPSFFNELDTTDNQLLFLRSCKVLAHETGHMFGMTHCIAYHCIMNGSNNLEESDSQPIHLCPECLKKLQYATGFNIIKRYEDLGNFYELSGNQKESDWIIKRIHYLKNK